MIWMLEEKGTKERDMIETPYQPVAISLGRIKEKTQGWG